MNVFGKILVLTIVILTGSAALAGEPMKAKIVILATGGTIAGAAATGVQAGYTSGEVGVETLIGAVPQLSELADISGEQVANVGSQDMSDEVWLLLADRVNTLLASKDVDGIVITHGTDTIEETSYFLNLIVNSDKPVVMTAAMRPATALSADGPLNIFNAVAVAADAEAKGRGVLIVINDDIHGARGMTKTSTTDVQTFVSAERGLMGATLYGENRYYRSPYRTHTSASEFSVEGIKVLPRVDVIYISAGVSPDLIDAAVDNGAKGIVTAGVGNGNMTGDALQALERARAEGVVVVRSTRVTSGTVGRNVETDDDAMGTVASGELNPAQSRVLLKLILTKTDDPAKVQAYFNKY
ncbi:type II asparaginase [Halieaceae bacterium IMCC8485]|jgi:L-asparaginase|uniref:Type II asparaginase n=1 Tax=Candidatus Seongchinamella marina TaxID=2518990 RepID=A0ABT3SSW5_9GAMM|nr:type II asparaginase [Candidatus Seongchinamella marina]MCX2972964.1 type II asparaginase [Candidatus Seongchinamella marina]